LRYTRQYAERRKADDEGKVNLNRLYAVEPTPSLTGLNADHRLALRPAEVAVFARLLARELGVGGGPGTPALSGKAREGVRAVARDLLNNKGRSAVLAGDGQPAAVHALAHAMSSLLEDIGADRPVYFTEAPQVDEAVRERHRSGIDGLSKLVEDMRQGGV